MPFSILCLACLSLGQWESPEAPAWARDFEFERIQVEWIAEVSKVPNLEAVIPGDEARLLRVLKNPDYTARELAHAEIERRGADARNMLYWGLRVDDPNIRHHSALILYRLFNCENCGGARMCPSCEQLPPRSKIECPENCGYRRWCKVCDGAGNWLLRRAIQNAREERTLFPPRTNRAH
jgi:hypothetical protein